MADTLLLVLATVLVNNFVLTKFLGLCPFMGVSQKSETAWGMALATTWVLTLASGISYLIQHYLLAPYQLEYLQVIAFILAIAAVVQLTEIILRSSSPLLYRVLGIYLPLITTNCAVLGVAILNTNQQHSFFQSLVYGCSAAIGFALVLNLFALIRERIDVSDVPSPFKGPSIALVTAGIMSLAFMGFSGMVK